MDWKEFFGGAHESEAFFADQQETVNWYPAKIESTGKPAFLPTPGVEVLSTAAVGAGRAHFYQNGREFAVVGTTLYEVASSGTLTSRGTVTLGGNPATISSNGDIGGQLLITSGGNGYIFDLDLNTLTQVTALNGKATMGAFLDARFVVLDAAQSKFYFSNLAPDGDVWDTGEDFGQRSLAADRWAAMAVHERNMFLVGESTGEAWYDTGQAFPYTPRPEGVFPYGVTAPFSLRALGDSLAWLATTGAGRRCVVRARGSSIEIISNKALETLIESYDDVENAVADVYSERGHTFYYLNFDGDNITWAYDTETALWSKRQTWVTGENRFVSWRPRFAAFAFGELRILDAFGGSIYRMSGGLGRDVDSLPIKRVRRAPVINAENRRLFFPGLELQVEPQESLFLTIDAPLIARFTWTEADWQVNFDSSTSESDVGIASYAWDFGDTATSTEASPDHTYASSPDTFTATLTITDAVGRTATVSTLLALGSGSAEGSLTSTDTTGVGPYVMLRFSNDGGKTWPFEQWRSAGKTGEWGHRVRWNRLGSARKRVFEVSTTDPVPFKITGCFLGEPLG